MDLNIGIQVFEYWNTGLLFRQAFSFPQSLWPVAGIVPLIQAKTTSIDLSSKVYNPSNR